MQVARAALLSLCLTVSTVSAADRPFTVALTGWGRACAGGLFVRTKTIEWNTTFVTCKPSPYELLESSMQGGSKVVVLRILKPSKGCIYNIIKVRQSPPEGTWDVTGFQSLDAYRNHDQPEWFYTTLPERNWLSCPMEESRN
ncbi:MAG: hypothetical protein V4636_08835 [Pseudomonadota bacterium]